MMRLVVLALTALLATSVGAQVDVQLRLDRERYLLYEPIIATVQVNNYSAQPFRLTDQESSPWLRVQVVRQDGQRVPQVGPGFLGGSAQLDASQALARAVDLVAFYQIRGIGKYRANAMVRVAGIGGAFSSNQQTFEVTNGRQIWTKTVGVTEDGKVSLRTYSLMVMRMEPHDWLYARVEDSQAGVIYGVLHLGVLVLLGPPRVEVDKESNLHVLHQIAPRHYRYALITPKAVVVKQESYSDFDSRPTLTRLDDGRVRVVGGEWIAPPGGQQQRPKAPPPPPPREKR
jgi:hypothetical protein